MLPDSFISGEGASHLRVVYAFAAISIAYLLFVHEWELHAGIPEIQATEDGGFKPFKTRPDLFTQGKGLVDRGLRQFPSCFQIATAQGPRIILPNCFVDEVRNNPHFDFNNSVAKDFFAVYPGFEPFYDECNFTMTVVRTKLTQSLNYITEDFASETVAAFQDLFNDSEEIALKPKLLDLIARFSTRVFIGPELCTNNEWLDITTMYTLDSFIAAHALRSWPAITRLIEMRDARRIIQPVLEDQRARNRKAREAGESTAKVADAVGWIDDAAKGYGYDAAAAQIGLALAANHTTTQALCSVFFDLLTHPEHIELLRDEIRSVLGEGGWKKTSLYQLRLMDSLMKESQRYHMLDFGEFHESHDYYPAI
ncbi:hypothetical protein QQX98_003773 [Neonectria punicea]|uniref:Cytochrome P450 n=1 Tax=Neonectria punicea TaxID=979145 RepID=A0ABR1HCD1_9HYPO